MRYVVLDVGMPEESCLVWKGWRHRCPSRALRRCKSDLAKLARFEADFFPISGTILVEGLIELLDQRVTQAMWNGL